MSVEKDHEKLHLDFTDYEDLKKRLFDRNIKFKERYRFYGKQILVRVAPNVFVSTIIHLGSYGHQDGQLESAIIIDSRVYEPTGYLTSEQAFEFIKSAMDTYKGG